MARGFPGVTFERYVDDAVVHCVSEAQAHQVLAALQVRMSEVGLELHPDKTKVVYCKDSNRRGSYEHTAFTFLGFTFRGREVRPKTGKRFTGFNPSISNDALKKIGGQVGSVAFADRMIEAAVLEELLPAVWHHVERYANNPIEADHSHLKQRLRPMRELRTAQTAQVIIAGHAFMQNLRRGHYELAVDTPTPTRVAMAFADLAQAI